MSQSRKQWIFVVGIIGLAAIIRFWAIGSKPGYEWDEPVYTNIATHLAHFGILQVKPDFGSPVEPYTYHPPFYFLIMAGWFKLVGAGVTSARVWAVLMSLVMMVLSYGFMRRYLGRAAIIPLILVATDGWLVYCNRISWIENTLLVIAIGAMWVYATALDTGSRKRFLAAGLLIGSAAIFKHVGVYLIAVAVVHWLIVRKHNRLHLQMFGVVGAVVLLYVIGMTIVFGHVYWHATDLQFERTFGNSGSSAGSVNSIGGFIKPTISQYYIFYSTILLALGSVAIVAVRAFQVIRRRSFEVIRPFSLLFTWAVASIVCFGSINLKFPQYSLLVLPPLYFFGIYEAVKFVRARSSSWKTVALVGMFALVALNGLTYYQRIASRDDNVLVSAAQYIKEHIPPHAMLITEEAVGDITQQPYCKLYHLRLCQHHAPYVVTYKSFMEQSPKQPVLERLVGKSIRLASFKGFKDEIAVYKVDKRLNSDAYPRYREHNDLIRQANQRRREEQEHR